jgi:hypothetical protein
VSDGQRWYAINDSGPRVEVFVLGRDRAVQRVILNSTDPYDVEDLAHSFDGRLWLSGTGDNDETRARVPVLPEMVLAVCVAAGLVFVWTWLRRRFGR